MLYVGVSNLFFNGVLLDRDQFVLHVKSMCVCACVCLCDDGHRYLKLSQDCIRKLQVIFPPASLAVGHRGKGRWLLFVAQDGVLVI